MDNSTIDLGNDIRLVPPTEEALEYIEQHFREGDAMEHNFFGGSLRCPEGQPSWVVMHGDRYIGVGGFTFTGDSGYLGDARVMWFLSCENVNREKIFFVRHSMEVVRAMVSTLPKWVKVILVAPMLDYEGSIRWLTKVLKFHVERKFVDEYQEFVLMKKFRKEIEDV